MKSKSSPLVVTVCEGSHPTGVRGLKLPLHIMATLSHNVAPHWGAWIEIRCCLR